ncbi:MAG: hypothetical protein KDD03_13145 [Gelidibacter sp.]|nr:hypothetical protein [Gelidibacter sp.]
MEKTQKNNKLIAEFMGNIPYINGNGLYEYMVGDKAPIVSTGIEGIWSYLLENKIFYNTWNDLMPVVKKVNSLHDQHSYFHIGDIFDELKGALYNVNILLVRKCIVKIIQWHNKENNK